MSQRYTLHPTSPQPRRIEEIIRALRSGAVLLYPTDTTYAIGCDLFSKSALEKVRALKARATGKPLTFLCPSLTDIARYAQVNDPAYRVLRSLVPGPYTFILPATKLVPQLVQNPKRKTIGIRVPNHAHGSPVTHIPSTILDLTVDPPTLIRKGLGWERVAHWDESVS
jgi:tRNA threonylcarbamoyl adenosine modification protein (Sua5/YciO/YrdC/YwlC family)